MSDQLGRRQFLGGAAAAAAGTTALAGDAAGSGHSIGDPIYTTDYIYLYDQPTTSGTFLRTVNADTGLEIDDGPWYNDGYKWWKYYVNGDGDNPSRARGYGIENYTAVADFAYPTWGEIVSTYWDERPFLARTYHRACDIANDYGTKVRASLGGTVTCVCYGSSYGNYVMIDHGYGWVTLYAHLQDFNVSEGQSVARDQVIGYMGCTGDCWPQSEGGFGPHVHFEIRKDGTRQNWGMTENTHIWWGTGVERNFW
jgi:murein DD-endopeptidase MepM/ murein hydrolase activator NlpD